MKGFTWLSGCILARMKFNQRLLILFGATFFSFTFFLMFDNTISWEEQQTGKPKLLTSHLWPIQMERTVIEHPSECNFVSSRLVTANFTTFDMHQQTDFSIVSDGSYPLPTFKIFSNESSRKPADHLTVILVPHSHNDPGWLKTVDEYYADQTKHILDAMVKKLTTNPNMTFVWAETIYMAMWWNDQEDAVKVQVRRLIRRGQLEIVLGGWVMPDEATTHYYAIIDQLIEGHRWVMDNLHVIPENSWSIDPFGHSGTAAYLWKQAGLKNMVIQRIHQAVKGYLAKNRSLEFYWRQYWDADGSTDILCHVMPYMLYAIKYSCGPDRFMCVFYDFRNIPGERREVKVKEITIKNLEVQAENLYMQYRKKASLYNFNTLLIPLGDDFRYDKEREWDQQYKNYALLFKYLNSRKDWNVHARFGTVHDYFDVLRKKQYLYKNEPVNKRREFPLLSGDFYTYSDQQNSYWSGYFSTRPFDKRFSRDVETNLRAADILYFLAYSYSSAWGGPFEKSFEAAGMLKRARRYLGLFQHHDAITGTAKEYVVLDYETKLNVAYNLTQVVMINALETLLYRSKSGLSNFLLPERVRLSPTTGSIKKTLHVTKAGMQIIIFNSLSKQRKEIVSVLVAKSYIEILDNKQKVIPCQVNPIWQDATTVSSKVYEVLFLAEIPPLGTVIYSIVQVDSEPQNNFAAHITLVNSDTLSIPPGSRFVSDRPRKTRSLPISLENDYLKVSFSGDTGLLNKIVDKCTLNVTRVNLDFFSYFSQGSGAYIFFPNGNAHKVTGKKHLIRIIRGPIASEIQVLHKFIHHRAKIYHSPGIQQTALHVENKIFIKNLRDREIIMRLMTDVKNENKTFFTDENGFQLIGRKMHRKLQIEANYYPSTTMALLEDTTKRLTLHIGESHGVASLEMGWLEIMLDRHLIYDDYRGLGEGVEDIKPVISNFILQIEFRNSNSKTVSQPRFAFPSLLSTRLNQMLQHPLQMYYTFMPVEKLLAFFHPAQRSLPCDVDLVSLRVLVNSDLMQNGTSLILHRKGFDCNFPTTALQCHTNSGQVLLPSLFRDVQLTSLSRTTLSHLYHLKKLNPNSELKLSPMEIASYILNS